MVAPYQPLYTVKEASQVLRVNTSKVYELINTGQLPYLLLGQKKIRGSDLEQFIEKYPVAQPEEGGIMQSEVIKYQPPVEGVVVTQEEEQQILKLGRIMREQLDQSHKDVRLFGRLSTVMAFLLGMESAVLFLMAAGIIAL